MSDNNEPKVNQKSQKEKTFDCFDKLSLKSFAGHLLQNIEKGKAFSIREKGAYTVSLNAEFGNGKTTFLEMFKSFIEDKKPLDYNVIFINAWTSDFHNEPVLAILSELANYIKENNEEKNGDNIIKIIGNISSQVIKAKTGIDLKEVKDSLKIGEKLLEVFNNKKETIREIKTALSEYAEGKKLLIIVDELDRARPDYAIHFLEDIKHFFDIENVVFLVAVNREQMEATVKCLYGQEMNFNGYYKKFFKQEVYLPDHYKENQKFIDELIQEKKEYDHPQIVNENHNTKSLRLSCKIFGLTLREIENVIRIFKLISSKKEQESNFVYTNCYFFFICLFIKAEILFKAVLQGKFKVESLLQYLKEQKINVSIKQQDNMSLINLLETVVCSLTTSESEEDDINDFLKLVFPDENPLLSTEDTISPYKSVSNRCNIILSKMHEHRKFQTSYNQFALEICEKIK